MNKKFSTLMAVGLLAGSTLYGNVATAESTTAPTTTVINAATDTTKLVAKEGGRVAFVENGTYKLACDLDLKGTFWVIDQSGVVIDGQGHTLTGRLVINAENVTVKNLKLLNNPVAFTPDLNLGNNGNAYWSKNGITVFANSVNITGVDFLKGIADDKSISNCIVVFPKTIGVGAYTIEKNIIRAPHVLKNEDGSINATATGILFINGGTAKIKPGDPVNTVAKETSLLSDELSDFIIGSVTGVDYAKMAASNTYESCYTDYIAQVTPAVLKAAGDPYYAYAKVTYSAALDNQAAIKDAIESSNADGSSVLMVNAPEDKVVAALSAATNKTTAKVAIQTPTAVYAVNGADVPAGNNLPVKDVTGTSSGVTFAATTAATKLAFGQPFVVMANTTAGKALKFNASAAASAINASAETFEKSAAFYWTFEKVETSATEGYAALKNGDNYLKGTDGKYLVVKLTKADNTWSVADLATLEFYSVNDLNGSAVKISSIDNYTLGEVPTTAITAGNLQSIFGSSFNVAIKRVDGNKALANNPFADDNLKPVMLDYSTAGGHYLKTVSEAPTAASTYMLQKSNGNLIVMQTDAKYADAKNNTYGFKLVEITPEALALALNSTTTASKYAPLFTVNALDNFRVGVEQVATSISVQTINKVSTYYLGSLNVDKVPTLSAENEAGKYLDAISIKLGKFNKMSVKTLLAKPTFFTVSNVNTKKVYSSYYGKVLALNNAGEADAVNTSEVLTGYPETQWAITTTDGVTLTLANREKPSQTVTLDASQIYNTDKTNVYAMDGDTIQIKPVATFAETDGYLRLDANKLRDQQYHVGIYSPVWKGNAWLVENHQVSHQIGLDTEKDKATTWGLASARYVEYNSLHQETVNRPDTILIGSSLGYWNADDEVFTTTDDEDGNKTVNLKLLAYSLKNTDNGEYMNYNSSVTRYTTAENGTNKGNTTAPEFFALKMTGNNQYNMIPVTGLQGELTLNYDAKIYGGDSADKGILNNASSMYAQTENDLFVVEEKDAPEYLKLNQGDTIKIYRAESASQADVVYEKGEFAGIANAIEFKDINPALYVDTVYVNREGNNRWEYLLGVNVNRVDTTYKCNVPSHGVHYADTTYGRFLVNLADSAIVEDTRDLHNNKYVYEISSQRYAKLGFVKGFRTNDTLYVDRINNTYDTIQVGTPDRKLVKFAFRIVDQATKSFIVETGMIYPEADKAHYEQPITGYLRWINGNLVVTSDIKDAEVFMANLDENRTPTSNDQIGATEVQVIAGNGVVTIKGAAGKSVIVNNILGQTIASTVLTSDNATIAVPAGIVVVAVEGEETVKTVVK